MVRQALDVHPSTFVAADQPSSGTADPFAGLRGFYGWLALHCQAARSRLLDADPLTAVVYGDAKPLPPADKRHIINGLQREAERYAGFRWNISLSHPFGALAAPELAGVTSILNRPTGGGSWRVSRALVR